MARVWRWCGGGTPSVQKEFSESSARVSQGHLSGVAPLQTHTTWPLNYLSLALRENQVRGGTNSARLVVGFSCRGAHILVSENNKINFNLPAILPRALTIRIVTSSYQRKQTMAVGRGLHCGRL